jgi:hypothetical protein
MAAIHGSAVPTRTRTDCYANTCTRTPTWPRSPRTSSTLSLRNSTTARVEYLAGPPRRKHSALPSPNRCCVRLLSSSFGGAAVHEYRCFPTAFLCTVSVVKC